MARNVSVALTWALIATSLSAAPNLKDKSPIPAGTWTVRYHPNQAVRVYIVAADGEVSFPDGSSKAKLVVKDKDIVLDLSDGKIERWTLGRDGRLFVEHFNPKSSFPDNADQIGIGTLKPPGK